MATKNNLQDVLKRLGSNGGTPGPTGVSATPSSAKPPSKFKPAAAPTVRRVPSLPTFSTAGFGRKKPPPQTPIAAQAPAPIPSSIASISSVTEVAFIEKKSNSPGTKREAIQDSGPIKRLKDIAKEDKENQRATPSRRKNASPKEKSPVKPRKPPPRTPVDDEDRPWLRMDLDEDFEFNPFKRMSNEFPTLIKPLPHSPPRNEPLDEASLLQDKLFFNEGMQKDNSSAIQQYYRTHDPSVDIATLEAIRDLLRERIQSLKELMDALRPESSMSVTTSPYFRNDSSSASNVAGPSSQRASPPIDVDNDSLWDDMEDIPDVDDDGSLIEIIDDELPSTSSQASDTLDQKVLKQSPYYAEIMSKLRKVYRLDGFRHNQLEAITAAMSGKDVFVLMPTGGGKSLCYQLPGVCRSGKTKGVSIVVSPLLALMQNQVDSLKDKGVDVLLWNSETADVPEILRRLRSPNKPSLLYVTPEKLKDSGSLKGVLDDLYRQSELARFVVDEAHCIATWGKDFREAYLGLSTLRRDYPSVPIMALTATANQQMVDDIKERLHIQNCAFFTQSFNRENLNYLVLPKKGSVLDDIVKYIQSEHHNQTGVLYCLSRDKCEKVAGKLREKGLSAKHYHAKMEPAEKERVQLEWQNDQCHIIVATIAFGMGIDKPDVRFVIHHDLPTSLDGYYQQTGRAGRDGKPADCLLYYTYRDFNNAAQMITKSCRERNVPQASLDHQVQEVRAVMQYAENDTACRRVQLLQFFGEKFDPTKCRKRCNNCANRELLVEEDLTKEARAAIELVRTLGIQNLTLDQARSIFRGRQPANKPSFSHYDFFGAGSHLAVDIVEQLFNKLLYLDVFMEVSLANGSGWHSMYLKLGAPAKINPFLRNNFKLKCRPKAAKVVTEKPVPKRRKTKKTA